MPDSSACVRAYSMRELALRLTITVKQPLRSYTCSYIDSASSLIFLQDTLSPSFMHTASLHVYTRTRKGSVGKGGDDSESA